MARPQAEPARTKRPYVRRAQPDAEPAPARQVREPMTVDIAEVREQGRETRPNDRPELVSRDQRGRAQVLGRNGELLARTRTVVGDTFYVDPSIIPDGWSYEWKVVTVYGERQISHQSAVHANGWRPVPASRHNGIFMSPGHDGPVEKEGQMLMERPMILTQEAREDAKREADNQVKMKQQALGETMPQGFTMDHKNLPNRVQSRFEPGDVSRQKYQPPQPIAGDDE